MPNYFIACTSLWIACLVLRSVDAEDSPLEQSHFPAERPAEAVALFDGHGEPRFVSMDGAPIDWKIEGGELISTKGTKPRRSRANHIVSTYHFRDAEMHIEFQLPDSGTGNSGVYIHGYYEVQIIDSHDKKKPSQHDAGAVYGFAPPLVNACRERGKWQNLDIQYHAPRWNAEGRLIEKGTISAWLNGQLVQDKLRVDEPRSAYRPLKYGRTPYLGTIEDRLRNTSTGPVFLQDHDNAVRFRNVWIRALDDRMHEYEG